MGCCGESDYVKSVRKRQKVQKVVVPKVLQDQTIVFPEQAPELEGYKSDPEHPNRLLPDGPCCKKRDNMLVLNQDGTYEPFNICLHPTHWKRHQRVTIRDCHACPVRECFKDT